MKRLAPAGLVLISAVLAITSCSKTGSPAPAGSPGPSTTTTTATPPTISHIAPVEGGFGTTDTITGTHFSTTTANDIVYFNGKLAVVSAATTTQLIVTIPVLAGTGPVAVKVSGDSVSGPTFTYDYQYVVTTIAGGGPTVKGSSDGTGVAAQFYYPWDVTIDKAGNLFVVDNGNNEIRKVTPAGVVTTFAGNTTKGNADGTGGAASFFNPAGITIDTAGNLYMADKYNNEIRKITPAAVVTTIAGISLPGSADGPGGAARFQLPSGICIDPAGNLYITDWGNNEIRKITPTGGVTTIAGNLAAGNNNGTGSAASFDVPAGIGIDAAGNLYVGEYGDDDIRKISPADAVTTIAGNTASGYGDGTGSAAQFNQPVGIVADPAGNLYVTDAGNNEIRKITPAGVVTTIAGNTLHGNSDGIGKAARFYGPSGIAIDAAGNLYVADYENNEIRKISIQ
jgi:serine/threonine protein kinase, bacterial